MEINSRLNIIIKLASWDSWLDGFKKYTFIGVLPTNNGGVLKFDMSVCVCGNVARKRIKRFFLMSSVIFIWY